MTVRNIMLCLLFYVWAMPVSTAADEEAEQVENAEQSTEATEPAAQIDVAAERLKAEKKRKQTLIKGYQPVDVAGQQIDATYLEDSLGEKYGAVVIFHDHGDSFVSKNVVDPVRHILPDYGWASFTFALDYPEQQNILLSEIANDAATETASEESTEAVKETEQVEAPAATESEEVDLAANIASDINEKVEEEKALPPVSNQERISSLLAFIQSQDFERIVFVGYGQGGNVAIETLSQLNVPVNALMLVNVGKLSDEQLFETFVFPIADIVGANVSNSIKKASKRRKVLMKRVENENYNIRQVLGANKQFLGMEKRLADVMRAWLYKQFLDEEEA
jgi:pimeloyl-ACP methyl ester carboxylesterase